MYMMIERTADEIVIKVSSSVDTEDLQDLINYLRYKELTAEIKIDQEDIDKLADQINKDWWSENRDQLIK